MVSNLILVHKRQADGRNNVVRFNIVGSTPNFLGRLVELFEANRQRTVPLRYSMNQLYNKGSFIQAENRSRLGSPNPVYSISRAAQWIGLPL